jgi:hypothetical protein
VIIDVCSGGLRLTTRFGPDAATHPKIEVTGSTYTVYFSSGFWMRAETAAYYMNVYVQVRFACNLACNLACRGS